MTSTHPPLPPGVIVRAGVYYYQVRIPRDVQEHIDYRGKTHIKRSLKTKDPRLVHSRAALAAGEFHSGFERARNELIALRTPVRVSAMTDEQKADFSEAAILTAKMAAELGDIAPVEPPAPGEAVAWLAGRQNLILDSDVEEGVRRKLYDTLSRPPQPTSEAERRLDLERAHLAAVYAPAGSRQTKTLRQLIDDFENDDDRSALQPATARNYATTFAILREVVGEQRNIRTITRHDMKAVRRVMVNLPPYATDPAYHPGYAGWTYSRIAADVRDRLEAGEDVELLNPATIRKYLRNLNTLFGYALADNLIDSNPAQKLAPRREADEEEQGREPFTEEQLAKMFPPGWTPQDDVDWMLLFALYQGARGNEIAQLQVDDIFEQDGVWVAAITKLDRRTNKPSPTKRVKNGNSNRLIPLHRALIKAGFLVLVARRRAEGHERIFNTKPYNASCYESIRQDITQRLVDLGVKTDTTCFHSLRHNFRDACRDADLPSEHTCALGGWSTRAEPGKAGSGKSRNSPGAEAGYGAGSLVQKLKESIDKIWYPVGI